MHNQTKLITFVLFLTLASNAFCQSSFISGKTIDSTGNVIEYASVVLLKLPDSVQVASQSSNEKGEFNFDKLAKGIYSLSAFQVGYEKYFSSTIELDGTNSKQIDLVLKAIVVESKEVIVEAERPLVRQEPDKMVVDVENSVSNSGLTTLDVLKKSPGITVGRDGNLSIKGKSGVLIMIDDKALYMSESQLASLLKSIPSDQLKEIEIITSPSAKYDAVGSSGIINIRLKKAAYEGLTGSWNTSYGQGFYYKANSGINVSYKKKKLTLSAGFQYNNGKDLEKDIMNRTYLEAASPYKYLHSDGFGYGNNQTSNGLFNGEYKLTKKHAFTFDCTGSLSDGNSKGNTGAILMKQSDEIKTTNSTKNAGVNSGSNFGMGVGYKAKLDTNGTSISFASNYSQNTSKQNRTVVSEYFDSTGRNTELPFLFAQKNENLFDQFSLKSDYTKQIIKKIKLETGAKINFVTNQFPSEIRVTENGVYNENVSKFTYKEKVYAGYGMLNRKWGKWKSQIGLRIERTQISGYQESTDSLFTRNYTNLFPSGNLSFSPNKKTMLTLLYSRRIKRPEAYHLNPILISQDPYTSWGGNPYLLPQYSDNYELAYSMFGGILISTLSYSHNTDHISFALLTDPGTLKTRSTFLNMKKRDMTALSFTCNTVLTKWWTTNNFVNLFYTQFEGGAGYENLNYAKGGWTVNSTQTFKLPSKMTLELSGNYESPKAQNAFGVNLETWQVNAGITKSLWAGKGVLKVAFSDMFWKSRWATESTVSNTLVFNDWKQDSRVLMFTFTYKFGNKLRITQE